MERLSFYIAKFIELYITPSSIRNSKIDKTAKICSGVVLNNSEIGRYSYIGNNSRINNCKIGKFCSIAGDVLIGGGSHPIDWVSTSPVFHSKKNILRMSFSDEYYNPYKYTYIENDVWIGARVLIKSGIRIGNGAIVGMGSVVTKDIPEYEIWAGNPARRISIRFNEKVKKIILSSKWWDWSDEKLKKKGKLFSDLDLFCKDVTKG